MIDRDAGTTSDPLHLVKRKAVGSLSFESFAIKPDGTMIYGDELAPSGGNAGGGIYKFVPAIPFPGGGPITVPAQSPLASGTIYGLRVAASGSSNWGQGAETGNGAWVAGEPGRGERRGREQQHHSAQRPGCSRGSPGTTGPRTWTSIRSPPRTACSERAGPTPAA